MNGYYNGLTRRTLLGGAALIGAASGLGFNALAQQPKRGGTLRISNGAEPPDYDVHQTLTLLSFSVCAPCYSTLMKIDPQDVDKLIPDLAERTEFSSDGKTVTFRLRSGVKFHNGMDLTSDDVVYSLERVRNPPKGIISPRRALLANVTSIRATDPLTVVVELGEPQPDFLWLINSPFNVIYPKQVVQPLDATGQGMKRQIIGSGPFRVSRIVDSQLYELVRFDGYFGTPAHLDKIQFFPIKGEIERASALQSGQIDACFNFQSDSVLSTLRSTPGLLVQQVPQSSFTNVIPNVQKKPFDDIRVRQAISLAIDRDEFIRTVGPLTGTKFAGSGLLLPGSPFNLSADQLKQIAGYDTLPGLGGDVAANRRRAMELLVEAGVPKGLKVGMPARADATGRDAAINIASQLNRVGLETSLEMMESGAFFAAETSGRFDIVVHSIALTGSTVDQILGECYTSDTGRNYGKWRDEVIDKLFKDQARERDPVRRAELIREFQMKFMGTFNQINIAFGSLANAHKTTLKGWKATSNLYANMTMDQVWFES